MIEKEIELERKVLRGDIAREVITFEEAVPADSKSLQLQNVTRWIVAVIYIRVVKLYIFSLLSPLSFRKR